MIILRNRPRRTTLVFRAASVFGDFRAPFSLNRGDLGEQGNAVPPQLQPLARPPPCLGMPGSGAKRMNFAMSGICVKTYTNSLTRLVLQLRIKERKQALVAEGTVGREVLSGLAAERDLRGGFCGQMSKTPSAGYQPRCTLQVIFNAREPYS